MRDLEEGFEQTFAERAEVGDRVEFTVPADEQIDKPGTGTVIRIVYAKDPPYKFFVVRMDSVDVELCNLPGIVHVSGPKYGRHQIAAEDSLIWLGEHIPLEKCEECGGYTTDLSRRL